MNPFLTDLLNYLAPAVGATLLCAAIACASYLYQAALQKLPANVRVQVQGLAETVVQAVEQHYQLLAPGSDVKKQEALNMLTSICASLDIPLDTVHASAVIEAAVYVLNHANPVPPVPQTISQTQGFPRFVQPTTPMPPREKPDQS
jgi:hypothetical protein